MREESFLIHPCLDVGRGSVVLIPIGPFDSITHWLEVIEKIKLNNRVIILRLPVFDYSMDYLGISQPTIQVNHFIQDHQLAEVSFLAHEKAGALAFLYAYSFPATVGKIIITGSKGLFTQDSQQIVTEMDNYDLDNAVEESISTRKYPNETAVEQTSKARQVQPPVALILNRIDHPVLLLWGTEDEVTSPDYALHHYDFLQNSELQFIKDASHWCMSDHANEFSSCVTQFLRSKSKN